MEFHPSFPVVSSNIALLLIPSEFGVYDVKRLTKSCSEFGGRQLNVCYTIFVLSAKISPSKMASSSKRARVSFISAEIALEKIFDDEDSADGMDSGEESDLDRQIEVRSQYRPSRNGRHRTCCLEMRSCSPQIALL